MKPETLELLRCPLSGGPLAREGDVLVGEAGTWPIVGGIPVFRPDVDELVELVRAGQHELAIRRAAFGEIPPAGWHRVGGWLADTRLAPAGRRVLARHRDELDRRSTGLVDPDATVRELFELAYRDLRLRNPEVFAYNFYRYGLPRHLAALAAIEWAPTTGPVLDVGCGAGHLTAALGPDTVGVDGLFFALYVAATRLAPQADFVCCELESLPFADDAFGGVWASDVLHAISRKAQVVREMDRVTVDDAWGAVVGLAVAGFDHEYPGRPLSHEGYQRLFPAATLVADDDLVDGYLARRAATRTPGEGPTVTALWGDGQDGRPFDDWPHARGELGLNPLLAPDGVLRFPTPAFEREHGALRRWTPATADLADDEAALVEQFVLLGLPPGYA